MRIYAKICLVPLKGLSGTSQFGREVKKRILKGLKFFFSELGWFAIAVNAIQLVIKP